MLHLSQATNGNLILVSTLLTIWTTIFEKISGRLLPFKALTHFPQTGRGVKSKRIRLGSSFITSNWRPKKDSELPGYFFSMCKVPTLGNVCGSSSNHNDSFVELSVQSNCFPFIPDHLSCIPSIFSEHAPRSSCQASLWKASQLWLISAIIGNFRSKKTTYLGPILWSILRKSFLINLHS